MNDANRTAILDAIAAKVDELRAPHGGLIATRRLAIARTRVTDTVKAAATDSPGGSGPGGHGDPTLATVIAHDPTDTTAQLAAWDRLLEQALDALCGVTNGTGGVLRELAQQYEPPVEQPAFRWCQSCKREGLEVHIAEERYTDLCRNCGEWKAAHDGKLPPRMVLRAWYDGHPRVTTQFVAKAMRAQARGR